MKKNINLLFICSLFIGSFFVLSSNVVAVTDPGEVSEGSTVIMQKDGTVTANGIPLTDQTATAKQQIEYSKSTTATSGPTQFNYTLLESFPGFFSAKQTLTDLPALVLAIYKFGIWTVGIAGLFMIVIGGIMYMTSAGNTSSANSAKGIIWDAIFGIIGALSAYLFMYVINPDLVRINLNFTRVSVEEPSVLPSEIVPLPGQLSDAVAKQRLSAAGISVKNNVCTSVGQSNCTTLEGIPAKAINGLIAMKQSCPSCDFFVTGGTEGGHQSHGPGKPMIDVRYSTSVRSFLANTKSARGYEKYGLSQVCTLDADLTSVSYNRSYDKQCKDPSSESHFHLSFGL